MGIVRGLRVASAAFARGRFVGPFLVAAALAGCNGGGSPPPVMACLTLPAMSTVTGTGWGAGITFDNRPLANQIRGCEEFQEVNADLVTPPPGNGVGAQSNPYVLHNVHWALSEGVTGAGTLVAVLDSGFRATHQEIDGKVTSFGTLPVSDHGTHVASLIAGDWDGLGMHGVAPDANLYLFGLNPLGGTVLNMTHIVGGIDGAATAGAVALNNSWGFPLLASDMATYLGAGPHSVGTVAAGFNHFLGSGTPEWTNFINALDDFQQSGVVVFAISNEPVTPDAGGAPVADTDIMAALPFFVPTLGEAWIAVVNGYFEVNTGGDILFAELLSNPCGSYTARFCLAGDGTTYAASGTSNTSYATGTGTSFVAPQVSGAVALLAQAFPDLTPAEWTARLLATADNSFFSTPFTWDFGNGVTHGYSNEWGHGVLDVRQALAPIGTVFLTAGDTLATAERVPLAQGVVAAGTGFGDGLEQALTGHRLAVFDALNGNFGLDAGALVATAGARIAPTLMRSADPFADNRTLAADAADGPRLAMTGDLSGYVYGTNGGVPTGASVLSLADNAAVVGTSLGGGAFGVSLYGFAADHGAVGVNEMAGLGAVASLTFGGSAFSFGVGQSFEHGALLGLVGNPVFDFGSGSRILTAHAGFTQEIGGNFSIFGNVEVGVARATGSLGNSIVAAIGPIGFNGFSLGATARSVLSDRDSLTLSFNQPMRVNSGTVAMVLPAGRTAAGDITTAAITAALTPSGRQRDIALTYGIEIGARSELKLSAIYSLDAGNIAGERGFGLAAGYGFTF